MLRGRTVSTLGDPRWISASPHFATYAPLVVLSLLVLAIIQVALGIVWVAAMQDSLTFATILQPIVLPSLSFFNTIPSAHLHILARSNNSMMVICFSSPMAILYLASSIISLVACSTDGTTGFQRAECPVKYFSSSDGLGKGPSQAEWDAVVALWLCSAVGYGVHIAMAWRVRSVLKRRVAAAGGDAAQAELVMMDPETKARMEQEARDRWSRIVDL